MFGRVFQNRTSVLKEPLAQRTLQIFSSPCCGSFSRQGLSWITAIPDFGFNFFHAKSCFLWCHRNCIAKAQCPLWMPFAVVVDAALTVIVIPRRALCINRKPQARRINKYHLLPQFTLLLCCALNCAPIDMTFNNRHEPDIQPDKLWTSNEI